MRRALLLFILSVLMLAPVAAVAAGKPQTMQSRVARIEALAAQIRGLKPLQPVKAEFLGNTAFAAAWSVELHQDQSPAEIELNRRESILLGFLGKQTNLQHLLFSESASQVAGFYDYHHKVLYVRNQSSVTGVQRHVIAHEYTHALQDQHYDLLKLLPDQFPLTYRDSDAVAARHALIEGDAVTTEDLFIHRDYSERELRQLIAAESNPIPGPALPTDLRRQFDFPYITGVNFVQSLYRQHGMSSIDAAYRRLPQSTYEIMYPNAYLRGWRPVPVTLHAVHALTTWQQTDDDVFGAFGYDLVLWRRLGQHRALSVLKAYRGDRYLFLQSGTQNAMLLKSVWSSPVTARTAESAYLSALRHRYTKATVKTGPQIVIANAASPAISLRVTGSTLTIAYAPTRVLATQLGSAATT